MATTAQASCASCGKPASAYCPDCVEIKDGEKFPTTRYCNKRCQVADRPKHKIQCKHREIYRAAEIHQAAFYAIREIAYDLDIVSVTPKGKELEYHHRAVNPSDMWEKSPLFRFPNNLVTQEDDKKSILAHAACSDAVGLLYELRKRLLQGFSDPIKLVEEGGLAIKTKHERVRKYLDERDGSMTLDGGSYPHAVVVVSCASGNKFILDAAGAQYGQYSPVMMRSDYLKTWSSADLLHTESHGSGLVAFNDLAAGGSPVPGADLRIYYIQLKVTDAMNAAVDAWEKKNGKPIHWILKQEQATYEAEKEGLLKEMSEQMRDFVVRWEASPKKYDPKLVARAKAQAEKLNRKPGKSIVFDKARMGAAEALASLRLGDEGKDPVKEAADWNSWAASFIAEQEAMGTKVHRL